jgi:citrate lyase subunit beta / citryl-CoA lyase
MSQIAVRYVVALSANIDATLCEILYVNALYSGDWTMTLRPLRSALYMPGSNARAIEKARTLATDVVILDLEDAVAPDAKANARAQVCAAVAAGGFGPRQVVIRVNGIATPWFDEDVAAALLAAPDAILVPKVEAVAHVAAIERRMVAGNAQSKTRAWAMIETPRAILDISAIARACAETPGARLDCFVLGTNDLIKETHAEIDSKRTAALYWLSSAVTAARAYNLAVLDGVFNAFKDLDGLERECQQGRMLGFDGKTLIHPDQVHAANRVFAPSETDVAWARKIIAAFALSENAGKGVITLDGRMVELLHGEMARRTVAIADAISDMSKR